MLTVENASDCDASEELSLGICHLERFQWDVRFCPEGVVAGEAGVAVEALSKKTEERKF
ncbi:hypothetical protein BRADI_4g20564v3 [Brachypodium distachyon]|uniref:Uncharacterized protein n=1 Tax=Brachypodium distachyon TaxID=15368 RepID=A0A2K2CNZ8_BRADI|nr:hypothetical protein BRADI_4g20564v3 [Brachypodium distachyon]